MTAIYQRLPFLRIPENPSYASEYSSQYVSRQSSLLAEGFNIYGSPDIKQDENKDQQRLPPINRCHGFGKGSGPPLWAYGTPQLTPQLIQLLFGGNVPKIYGKQWQNDKNMCNFPKAGNNYEPLERKTELWDPKDWKKCQLDGRRTEQKILNARWRQRQIFEAISSKLNENRKQAEDVLLKKIGTMERGKQAYLVKMDKNAEKIKQNRKMLRSKKIPKPLTDEQIGGHTSNNADKNNVSEFPCVKTEENLDTMDSKPTECDDLTTAVQKESEIPSTEPLIVSEDLFKIENTSEPFDISCDKLTLSEEQLITAVETEQAMVMADEKPSDLKGV